jgi:hypothetical protein
MPGKFDLEYSEPILLNVFKHHANFLIRYIDKKSTGDDSYENIADDLKLIGHSLIDVYYGALSPMEISEEIINYLNTKQSLTVTEYKKFLVAGGEDYRIVELSDSSKWILRLGIDTERYVHIHPAKYSSYTERVRAFTLKSAILTIIFKERDNEYMTDLGILNYVRTEYLELSPQKNLSSDNGVGKILNLLKSSL